MSQPTFNRFKTFSLRNSLLLLSVIITAACSGGGGGGGAAPTTAASPTLTFSSVKIFRFTWTDVDDATFYRLLENPDGTSGFSQIGADITAGAQNIDHVVPLYARINAQYILQSCNASGCTDSATVSVSGSLVASIGYAKASNTETNDEFGRAVSLAADGNTLAVGAYGEGSNATGINGDATDNSATAAGAVYVFSRNAANWSQQAYVKASNTGASDRLGYAVSLAADGNTLAVAAYGEDSNATGINGDATDNSATAAGAVYVFSRNGSNWSQQAYVKASNTGANDLFGRAVSLAADGNTLAVGAYGEDSNATGINGDATDDSAPTAGAVYVFSRNGSNWSQQAYVKASNTGANDWFGRAVSLAADGNTLAVAAYREDSNATGINGDATDNSTSNAGAVYVFSRNGANWSQQAYVKASNTETNDEFGRAVSLAADGNTLAVAAYGEDSNATGINGDATDNSATAAGAVYVFSRNGSNWSQQAYVKASNTGANDLFGRAVSLAADGNTLAVGAYGEDSNATGINGDATDDSAPTAGAVYVFSRNGSNWSQQAYVKASNTGANDRLGYAVSLAADGNTLAVAANGEGSNATGINGDATDNSAPTAGAVYLY